MEYQSETKKCQNCHNNFQIEPDDFVFYEKIKVPAPTFCPECRAARRMVWRNERALYKRECDAPGHSEAIISIYSQDKPIKVYDHKYWWSDEWDPLIYGKEYDFSKTLFEQFYNLTKEVPQETLIVKNSINSEYTNLALENKDSYLIFSAKHNENVAYAYRSIKVRDSFDVTYVENLELCYENINCDDCSKIFFAQNCLNCNDSTLIFDCKNCSNCFGCVGLRNKQYHIFNKPYSKREYLSVIKELDIGNFKNLSFQKNKFHFFKNNFPHKYANLIKTSNVIGDYVLEAKNCKYVFDIVSGGSEDSKFIIRGGSNMKNCYDCLASTINVERDYDSTSTTQSVFTRFSNAVWQSNDVQYSWNCNNSSNLFGCIGLRNKQYCILNKQYTKEEYEELVSRIIKHMDEMPYIDKKGRVYKYGEFFPPELSPFSYNETVAQEYFPLTKEQAIEQGYSWKDPEERNIQITLKSEQLPDNIKDVDDSILNQIIECQHASSVALAKGDQGKCNEQCTTAFKIIPQELEFYRKMNLPLPRLCPNCRHYQRIKQRNPLKLWKRQCCCKGDYGLQTTNNGENKYQNTIEHFHGHSPCPNTFETTYAPERPEIVYCEQCYNAEVV